VVDLLCVLRYDIFDRHLAYEYYSPLTKTLRKTLRKNYVTDLRKILYHRGICRQETID